MEKIKTTVSLCNVQGFLEPSLRTDGLNNLVSGVSPFTDCLWHLKQVDWSWNKIIQI